MENDSQGIFLDAPAYLCVITDSTNNNPGAIAQRIAIKDIGKPFILAITDGAFVDDDFFNDVNILRENNLI